MRLFVYTEKNKVQESVWVSGCAAVLAGRSESRICLCCLTSVGQNPIRVGSASCHWSLTWQISSAGNNIPDWQVELGTAVLNLSTALEHCAWGISSPFAALGCTDINLYKLQRMHFPILLLHLLRRMCLWHSSWTSFNWRVEFRVHSFSNALLTSLGRIDLTQWEIWFLLKI